MKRWWPWLGGMLVGVCLLAAGALFAGTVGRQLFVTDTGTLTYYPTSEANAFKICDSAAESNCHLFFIHPTDGPTSTAKCSGTTCNRVLQLDATRTYTIKKVGSSVISTYDADAASVTTAGVANYCADAGGSDTYACNMTPALDRYVTGGLYFFKANTANTGIASINFNSLGAKTIKKVAGGITTDLADNDIRVGQIVAVQYDGTNMQMQSLLGNAGSGGGGTAYPIRPYSAIPVTAGMVYGCIIDGDDMLCVTTATLLTSDAIWRLGFELPPSLPSCTHKLQLDMKANAATGVIRINPKWARWAPGVVRPTSLTAETVTPASVTGAAGSGDTVTLGTGDANQLIRIKWVLDGQTVTAGERIAMDLTFEDTSTTLAVESGYLPSIICE